MTLLPACASPSFLPLCASAYSFPVQSPLFLQISVSPSEPPSAPSKTPTLVNHPYWAWGHGGRRTDAIVNGCGSVQPQILIPLARAPAAREAAHAHADRAELGERVQVGADQPRLCEPQRAVERVDGGGGEGEGLCDWVVEASLGRGARTSETEKSGGRRDLLR